MITQSKILMSLIGDGIVYDTRTFLSEDRENCLVLDKARFREMGEPETITVSIQPGDSLNG